MQVDEGTDLTAERDGQTFSFCSDHCRQKFIAQEKGEEKSSCCHGYEPMLDDQIRNQTKERFARIARAPDSHGLLCSDGVATDISVSRFQA